MYLLNRAKKWFRSSGKDEFAVLVGYVLLQLWTTFPATCVVEVFLNFVFVGALCLSDASLEVGSGC